MDDYPEMIAIVRALAHHLREFPQHSDTAEGIATWWFGEHSSIDYTALADALEWMRERGLVEVRVAGGTGDRYRCSSTPEELDDVLHLLSRRWLT
jgi:hypothetical protein